MSGSRGNPRPRPAWLGGLASVVVLGLATVPGAAVADSPADAAIAEGSRALAAGDLEAAERAFVRATELDPSATEALLKLGITRSQRRDWPGAVTAYERLLAQEPKNAQAWNNLGNVWFRQDIHDKAAACYSRALEIDPDYLLALFHQGWIQRQQNLNAEAEASFTHCLGLTARNERERTTQVDCRFFLGTLRFRASAWAEAASSMEQVLQVHPSHAEARYYLGMAYIRMGRRDEGREQLEIHRRMLDARRRTEPIARPDEP